MSLWVVVEESLSMRLASVCESVAVRVTVIQESNTSWLAVGLVV